MKITIRKIAELAGVSRGTVDKVIHDRPGVSDEVRARVRQLLEEQGYQPPVRQSAAPSAGLRIAVMIPPTTNHFFEKAQKGIDHMRTQLADRYAREISLEYYYCDGSQITDVISLLDYIEAQRVDGVVMRGLQSGRLCDRLNRMIDNGIPVVLIDSDTPDSRRLCFVGVDSNISGQVAASLLAKSIGGSGEVAVIGGLPNMHAHRARMLGFEQHMRTDYPAIRVVEAVDCLDQSVIAYEQTVQLLRRYPKLRGIFSVVGCTRDIGQALIDHRAKEVKIVCYNFTNDTVALVKRGVVDFAIGLSPYRQGCEALRILTEYLLDGTPPPGGFRELPPQIGIDANIESLCEMEDI